MLLQLPGEVSAAIEAFQGGKELWIPKRDRLQRLRGFIYAGAASWPGFAHAFAPLRDELSHLVRMHAPRARPRSCPRSHRRTRNT